MKASKTILFFGTEDFSLITLEALVDAGYKIGAVITKPDSRSGRGQKIVAPAVKTYAQKHGIPVWQPIKLTEIIDDIKSFDNPIGVLVSYGKIIPASIIDLFDIGIINLHPSLLPAYRGPSPIESAIAHRDQKTGVSIMKLSPRMDAGPVYHQTIVELDHTETQPELYDKLGRIGAGELVNILPQIISGDLTATPQDESEASYCSILDKQAAFFDPQKINAADLEAKVRAHLRFPKTKFNYGDHLLTIKKSHVVETPKTLLDQQCQDGKWLVIDEVLTPNGKTTGAEDFLRGYAAA